MSFKRSHGVAGTFILAILGIVLLLLAVGENSAQETKPGGKYIGAEKCKNCHQAKKAGNQFAKWKEHKHAKAFETLASDAAKKLGKERGVDDPQKSPKCLKCHITAFEAPAEQLAKGFSVKLGVQCEACHGPGEKHFKARFAAASKQETAEAEEVEHQEIPDGEIVKQPAVKSCLACHNEESPSFKNFCFKKRNDEVAHLDPRKKRTPEDLAARKCGCGEKCECKKAECTAAGEKK